MLHVHICMFIHLHTPTVGAAVYTSVAGCAQCIRAHTLTVAAKVQTCWTFKARGQTSTGTPANHKSTPRSRRADTFCIGTYADVYRHIHMRVYTFIRGSTCAMQWAHWQMQAWIFAPARGTYACIEYKPVFSLQTSFTVLCKPILGNKLDMTHAGTY